MSWSTAKMDYREIWKARYVRIMQQEAYNVSYNGSLGFFVKEKKNDLSKIIFIHAFPYKRPTLSTVSWRKNNTAAADNIAKLPIFLCILDGLIAELYARAKRARGRSPIAK